MREIKRREFLGVLGLGTVVVTGVVSLTRGVDAAGAVAASRVWIDPRLHTLPKRPCR